jgi:YD repeat-containing protein
MLTYGDNVYTYTVNGSLLTKTNAEGVTEYSYDAMGNLLRVKLPDNRVITYQIDARGRRIGKKVDGVFQYGFIYGDQLNPIAKVDEAGNILESYVYGLKSNIPEYIIKDNKKYKIISNYLGSPIEIAEASMGALPVLQIKYDSFGNILEQNGNFDLPFGFAGGIWDKETKLTRFGEGALKTHRNGNDAFRVSELLKPAEGIMMQR